MVCLSSHCHSTPLAAPKIELLKRMLLKGCNKAHRILRGSNEAKLQIEVWN